MPIIPKDEVNAKPDPATDGMQLHLGEGPAASSATGEPSADYRAGRCNSDNSYAINDFRSGDDQNDRDQNDDQNRSSARNKCKLRGEGHAGACAAAAIIISLQKCGQGCHIDPI